MIEFISYRNVKDRVYLQKMPKRRSDCSVVFKRRETYYSEFTQVNTENDEIDQSDQADNDVCSGISQQEYDKIYMFGDAASGFKTTEPPQNFSELHQRYTRNKTLFKDENFCPELINLAKVSGIVVWKRPFEISQNPQFVIDGATRFDIDQGRIGDCWFLAAVANLISNKKLFSFAVPLDQNFGENYAGIFRFRFWQYGRWIEIVIDDRLPTVDNKLIYLKSSDPNEFWAPLFEKAYAKLYSSYKNIEGGQISEALEDMCGGLSEFHFASRSEIYDIMKMCYERSSFMGCSIVATEIEGERPDGLVTTHAYSITEVVCVGIGNTEVRLLRLRNPWGNSTEWKGAWSDNSECWNLVPEETRGSLLSRKADGEFWMEVEDFQSRFTFVDICHLGPSSFFYSEGDGKKWNISAFDGEWIPHMTAGGGFKYTNTFSHNPQYFMSIKGNGRKELYAVVIGLMQKNRRIFGRNELPLELAIYKVSMSSRQLLDSAFFEANVPIMRRREDGIRQLTVRIMLPVGNYCIIPSTADPNLPGSYLLRIYSETDANTTEIDDNVGYNPRTIFNDCLLEEFDNLPKPLMKLATIHSEIGWEKLRKALNYKFGDRNSCLMRSKRVFSKESSKNIVALWDTNYDGKLDYQEYSKLIQDTEKLKMIFEKFDEDRSGKLDGFELRKLFYECGFRVNKHILTIIILRYGSKGAIDFQHFVICAFKLKAMIDKFYKSCIHNSDDFININRRDWLQTTLYL